MTLTEKLKSLLTPILEGIEEVKYTEFSGGDNIDRFKADTITHAEYPVVFTVPGEYKIRNTGAGNLWADFQVVMYVLTQKQYEDAHSDRASWVSEERAFNEMEELTHEIYRQLRHQSHPLKIEFGEESTWKSERVMNVTMDLALGYEIRTGLTIYAADLVC